MIKTLQQEKKNLCKVKIDYSKDNVLLKTVSKQYLKKRRLVHI
jgi:hypothetical protein